MDSLAFSLKQLQRELTKILGEHPDEAIVTVLHEEMIQDEKLLNWQPSELIARYEQISYYFF